MPATAPDPEPEPEPGGKTPRICIVTPVYNGAAFLDEAIASVVGQAGDFVLHYHVQDGGSTDGSDAIVRKWIDLHAAGRLPRLCRKLVFTYASASDGGMYDAINTAFAQALPPGDDVMMAWIAADDRIAPGACATICQVRRDLPEVRWMGGRITLMNEAGCVTDVMPLHAFVRAGLAAGLYDGRKLCYVFQEGTFWCADLWHRVGGLDPSCRLAGDWDLWRRFAVHADYVSVDGLFGMHRKRPDQMSNDIGSYHGEVDRLLDASDSTPDGSAGADGGSRRGRYETVMDELDRAGFAVTRFTDGPYGAIAVRYSAAEDRWMRLRP